MPSLLEFLPLPSDAPPTSSCAKHLCDLRLQLRAPPRFKTCVALLSAAGQLIQRESLAFLFVYKDIRAVFRQRMLKFIFLPIRLVSALNTEPVRI